jgi:hypothetical protein
MRFGPRFYVQRLILVIGIPLWLLLASSPDVSASIAYPFCDDLEDPGSGNWSLDSPWGYTTETSHGGSTCITDSPEGALYEDNLNISCTTSDGLDLTGAVMPVLRFWNKYALEVSGDYGFVEVSTNQGGSWITVSFVNGSDFRQTAPPGMMAGTSTISVSTRPPTLLFPIRSSMTWREVRSPRPTGFPPLGD